MTSEEAKETVARMCDVQREQGKALAATEKKVRVLREALLLSWLGFAFTALGAVVAAVGIYQRMTGGRFGLTLIITGWLVAEVWHLGALLYPRAHQWFNKRRGGYSGT